MTHPAISYARSMDPRLEALLADEQELQFDEFTNDTAYALGQRLVDAARAGAHAVTIDIARGEQQLFHVALAGTASDNDAWIRRKNRVVRRFGHSSYFVGLGLQLDGTTIEARHLLDEREFAAHGGAFPIVVRNVGMVGTVTVSGLPQEDDHRLVAETLRAFLGSTPGDGARHSAQRKPVASGRGASGLSGRPSGGSSSL